MIDITQRRAGFDKLGERYEPASSVVIKQTQVADKDCYWFIPDNAKENRILIYIHGGAFAVGSIRSHQNMVSHFSNVFHLKTLFVEYRLAPENPYPQGIEDVISVYQEILREYPDHRIDIAGESAGGGIIVSAISSMVDRSIPPPASAVLISPWISLACAYPSQLKNNGKDIITTEYLKESAKDYIGEGMIHQVSPEFASLHGFPATLILAGTHEILLDDSLVLHERLLKANNTVDSILYREQVHNWPLADIHSQASQKLLQDIKTFLN